jgi:hypothetical protein
MIFCTKPLLHLKSATSSKAAAPHAATQSPLLPPRAPFSISQIKNKCIFKTLVAANELAE